ncbi:hypothetical protein IKG68_03245 [Candidatus Saccharibacteria bacterium]|nr:hypothetical protein [Candidatus Saccharibacteria bacterium]
MKTMKKLISLFLVMATIFALTAVPTRAAYTYGVQEALSEAASILRNDLGRADDDAAVRALSDQWHFENGTQYRNNGYYYSGIDEAFYYYNNTSSNRSNNRSNNYGSYSGNNRQQAAFRAYDLVSNYYSSTHPVVAALLDVLAAEYGESANLSYLYSAKDGNYYYFGASAVRGNRNDNTQYYGNNNGGSYSQGLVTINGTSYYNGWYNTRSKDDRISQTAYSYDGFTWYQYYADNREFFRVYNSNRVVWATEQEKNNILRYGTTPRGSSYLVAGDVFYAYNQNLSTRYNAAVVNTYGYQYGTDGYWDNGRWISYSTGTGTSTVGTTRTTTATNTSIFTRVNYYNGMFTGVEQYINTADAKVLAKILASYKRGDPDIRQVAAMGWSFMDYCGSRSYASCVSAYPDYDPNIATVDNYGRDLYKLACDLLFRKEAERHGITDVGRTLAKGNTFLWIENGVVYFRDRDCGADHSHDFNFTNVRNPYPSV